MVWPTIGSRTAKEQNDRLHRMNEMQSIVVDVRDVCLSVCPSVSLSRGSAQLGFTVRGLFGAAFAKSLWPLVQLAAIQ